MKPWSKLRSLNQHGRGKSCVSGFVYAHCDLCTSEEQDRLNEYGRRALMRNGTEEWHCSTHIDDIPRYEEGAVDSA